MTMSVPVHPDTEIHPAFTDPMLRELIHPDRMHWTPMQLRDLTSTVAAELTGHLLGVLRYDTSRRWWARLAVTGGVELWLLSWLPGQGTGPHDHGGAAGSFTVLLGELAESWRYPTGPIRDNRHSAGAALGFGAGRAHDLRNGSLAPAASVHAYSPPMVATRKYASLWEVPDVIPPLIPEPRA